MLQAQFLSCIASIESTARRPLSLDPKTFQFVSAWRVILTIRELNVFCGDR